jgi:molybdopterin converting factor subunit 1
MTIRLRFFAMLRERAGVDAVTRVLADPATVAAVWQAVRDEYPGLAAYSGPVRFAVNQDYVDSDSMVQDNDEVAFIPPVSGG